MQLYNRIPSLFSPTSVYKDNDKLTIINGAERIEIDGATSAITLEILREIGNGHTVREIEEGLGEKVVPQVIDFLYEEGVIYFKDELASISDITVTTRLILESILVEKEPNEYTSLVSELQDKHVDIQYKDDNADTLVRRLTNIGITVEETNCAPDLIYYNENSSRNSWESINQRWLESESTLIRSYRGTNEFEIGPILSPSASSCLNCLYTRKEINEANEKKKYDFVSSGPTIGYNLFIDLVTYAILSTLTSTLPNFLSNTILYTMTPELETNTAQLFGLPKCEYCD